MESEFAKAHAIIYAISNEGPDKQDQMRAKEKLGEPFVFLTDPEGKLAKSYAGTYTEGRMATILKPATIVVGRGGKIVYGVSIEDFRIRPPAQAVLDATRKSMDK